MNEGIRTLELVEPVLEIGVGAPGTALYHSYFEDRTDRMITLDIAIEKGPSILADLEHPWPIRTATFSTCLAFNILEHLYDFPTTLSEAHRILLPGGTLYVGVPFLYRVHSDPADYFRYTSFALEQSLARVGFVDLSITAFGHGACTAALGQIDFLLPRSIRRSALKLVRSADIAIAKRSSGYRNEVDYPLCYLARGKRPES